MVVAKNQKTFDYLKNLFESRKVEKRYLALVHGKLKRKEGKIEGEMGRSKRDFRRQALARGKISVRKGRYSLTYYKVLKYVGKTQAERKGVEKKRADKACAPDSSEGYSLLEVFPQTGRMHQIRVHLHSIGHPIVGDRKYTFKKFLPRRSALSGLQQSGRTDRRREYPRMFLHASEIAFVDQEGEKVKFVSPLPKEFNLFLRD